VPPNVLAHVEASCEVVRLDGAVRPTRDDLVRILPTVTGVLSSNQTRFDNELIAANPHLRVISNFGVGYDNVDIPFATEHGLLVCNTPGVLSDAVADLAYGFIIALAKRIVQAHGHTSGGLWGQKALPLGIDLKGKTLGILGFGRIGHAVAARAPVFGLRVLYYDPIRDRQAEERGAVTYAERDEVIRNADFLTVHVFLDPTTRGHVSDREFGLMKPSAYFINTSRGPVVDQRALTEALRSGKIAGAALDVFEVEPVPADDPLLGLPNVLLAPHMGTATVETRQAMAELCGRNLVAAVTGATPEAMVNPEVLRARS
jgi:glyoxylate reductase